MLIEFLLIEFGKIVKQAVGSANTGVSTFYSR